MRLVTKDIQDIPNIFLNATIIASWELIAQGNISLINDSIYKGSYKDHLGKTQSAVRDKLNKFYFTKCAYCETYCKAEIEHYRPKKGVDDAPDHSGYFWLCYEWTNLIPSCRYCNTEGGKGNKFPVKGKRIIRPEFLKGILDKSKCKADTSPLLDEFPFLIHPEIIDPKGHLEFCWDDNQRGIRLIEKNNSEMGKQTIQICNLNRDYLLIDRLVSVLHPIQQNINLFFTFIEKGIFRDDGDIAAALKIYFSQLEEEANNIKIPHTFLRWYIISTVIAFEEIIIPYIQNDNQKTIVLEVFKDYMS